MTGQEGAVLAGIGFLVLRWRLKKPSTLRGAAQWMTLWQAVRARLIFPLPKGLIVGDWKPWALLPLFYRGDSNILTVGPPGSLKGVGMLIPNALRWPFLFLFDPGGETTAVCIKEWRAQGYNVYCPNPWEMHSSNPWRLPAHAFNSVDLVDPTSRTFASDADLLAEMLVVRTGREADAIWNDKGQEMLKILIMHCKTVEAADKQNLLTIRRYLLASAKDWEALLMAMQKNTADELIPRAAGEWSRTQKTAPKMFAGYLEAAARATAFVEDQVIRDSICHSDIPFDELKGRDAKGKRLKGTIISVIVPLNYLETHSAYVRLAIGCAWISLVRGKLARSKVLFMIDEFPTLGRMKTILNGLATCRKYRIWMHLVIQGIGQLKDIYGDGWTRVEDSCNLRQYIAAWSAETSEHVSRMCGTGTQQEGDKQNPIYTGRLLMTPEEVRQMPRNRQIVFSDSQPPAFLSIRPYWERPWLNGRYFDNPYHSRTPNPPPVWPLQALAGAGLRIAGWVLGPSRTFAIGATLGIIWWFR